MEHKLKKNKKWKTTSKKREEDLKKNGRRDKIFFKKIKTTKQKMEENLKKKWKTTSITIFKNQP